MPRPLCLCLMFLAASVGNSSIAEEALPADAVSPVNGSEVQTPTDVIASLQQQIADLQKRVALLEAAQRPVIHVQYAGDVPVPTIPPQPLPSQPLPSPPLTLQPLSSQPLPQQPGTIEVNGVKVHFRVLGNNPPISQQ